MKLLLSIVFVFFATDFCSGCSSSVTRNPLMNAIPAGTTHPRHLIFTAGDIISCDMETTVAVSDIFLATSPFTVIEITGPGSDGPSDETRILERDFLQAASHYKLCKVITKLYDEKYASICGGSPFSTSEILRRADSSRAQFRERTTHFNSLKCNWEHWVSAWRYGTSWTLQFGAFVLRSKYRSDDCEAPGKQECY